MVHIFLQGVVLGFIISVTIGPAFFAIIQTGISRGFKTGLLLSTGIIISDITLIVLCYFGAAVIFEDTGENIYNFYLGIGGGILLVIFGAVTFTRQPEAFKRRSPKHKAIIKTPKPYSFIIKGYFLNIANPFLIFFWIAAMSWVQTNASDQSLSLLNYSIVFFSGTLIIVFGMDLLKSFVGNKIKRYLTIRLLFWINKIVGVSLAVFGVILIFKSIWNFL